MKRLLLALLLGAAAVACQTDSAIDTAPSAMDSDSLNSLSSSDFRDSVAPMASGFLKGLVIGDARMVLPFCSQSLKERLNANVVQQTAVNIQRNFGMFKRMEIGTDFRQESYRTVVCKTVFNAKNADGIDTHREIPLFLLIGVEDGQLRIFAFSITPFPM